MVSHKKSSINGVEKVIGKVQQNSQPATFKKGYVGNVENKEEVKKVSTVVNVKRQEDQEG